MITAFLLYTGADGDSRVRRGYVEGTRLVEAKAIHFEVFTVHPGEILIATDTTGSGHKWRLVNDEPWKRAYVLFEKGAETHFVAGGA